MLDTVTTHGWINQVAHTEDIRLRSHRITLTYNRLGQQWDEVTFFDFATWGTHTVGRVIRGDLPRTVFQWLEPVQDQVANHLAEAQLSMFEYVGHEGVDEYRYGRPPIDIDKSVVIEQERVTKGITDAIHALVDHWGIDRDMGAMFFTKTMLGTELPNETLLPCERIKGTTGFEGAPVTDYRDMTQRVRWINGMIKTHMDDLSLKTPVYTPEEEKEIVDGTYDPGHPAREVSQD